MALFFLGFLILPEDAGQISALPVVEGAPGIQLPSRLTDAWGRKQRKRILRAAATPGIHYHPVRNPIDVGKHADHLPEGLLGPPRPAAYTPATFEVTDLLSADTQVMCAPLVPQSRGDLFGAHACVTAQVGQALSARVAPRQDLCAALQDFQ
ncbi:hypothetical protein B590_16159 [Streptomyces sp. PVA_94-07]|nr:hypothetical protein B590_16159 [Streptomyces sp. PVA_94-07]